MSPNFSKIYILNYVVDVMNDVIFMLEFPKFTLSNFYMNAFDRVLNSTDNGDTLHFNLLKTPIKLKSAYDVIFTAYTFF